MPRAGQVSSPHPGLATPRIHTASVQEEDLPPYALALAPLGKAYTYMRKSSSLDASLPPYQLP